MTTVIYIRSLLQGGAEKQALLLAEEMQKTAEVLLVVHTHDASGAHQDHSRIRNIEFLQGGNAGKFFALYKILRKNRVKNLICFLPVNNILGTFAGKLARTPNILCGIRGSRSKGKVKTFLLKFICNTLKVRFISNNHRSREVYIGMGFKAEQISVVHNGITVPAANSSIQRSIRNRDLFQLAAVGRFIPEKDIPTLLQSIHYLVHELQFTRFRLTLAGYGPLENTILEQISQLGLQDYIKIADGQTADLAQLYTAADLYILTSAHEGMPNTVMEAMSYKLPVVSTDAGDAKYLVASGENGFLTGTGDFKSIAEGIAAVFEDEDRYEAFSRRSFEKISTAFSTSALAAAYSKYLTK